MNDSPWSTLCDQIRHTERLAGMIDMYEKVRDIIPLELRKELFASIVDFRQRGIAPEIEVTKDEAPTRQD